ncbi:MAG: DUF3579 domain-containing protein [Gammaproteobacteria bacterium]|nr:MAG: DUF3579 domain-containing protein [Gammaproteobacteria bacterium]
MNSDEKWVIRGVTEEGKKLRPSDWIERISSTLANFGADQRLQYSNAVAPCMIDGEKCLVVARNLHDINPEAYDFVMGFARSNQLSIREDRRVGNRALRAEVA